MKTVLLNLVESGEIDKNYKHNKKQAQSEFGNYYRLHNEIARLLLTEDYVYDSLNDLLAIFSRAEANGAAEGKNEGEISQMKIRIRNRLRLSAAIFGVEHSIYQVLLVYNCPKDRLPLAKRCAKSFSDEWDFPIYKDSYQAKYFPSKSLHFWFEKQSYRNINQKNSGIDKNQKINDLKQLIAKFGKNNNNHNHNNNSNLCSSNAQNSDNDNNKKINKKSNSKSTDVIDLCDSSDDGDNIESIQSHGKYYSSQQQKQSKEPKSQSKNGLQARSQHPNESQQQNPSCKHNSPSKNQAKPLNSKHDNDWSDILSYIEFIKSAKSMEDQEQWEFKLACLLSVMMADNVESEVSSLLDSSASAIQSLHGLTKTPKIIVIPGDNNCLFGSLAWNFNKLVEDEAKLTNAKDIRSQICHFMETNEQFQQYFQVFKHDGERLELHCQKMKKHGKTWGGEHEIKAASMLYNKVIMVYEIVKVSNKNEQKANKQKSNNSKQNDSSLTETKTKLQFYVYWLPPNQDESALRNIAMQRNTVQIIRVNNNHFNAVHIL